MKNLIGNPKSEQLLKCALSHTVL